MFLREKNKFLMAKREFLIIFVCVLCGVIAHNPGSNELVRLVMKK